MRIFIFIFTIFLHFLLIFIYFLRLICLCKFPLSVFFLLPTADADNEATCKWGFPTVYPSFSLWLLSSFRRDLVPNCDLLPATFCGNGNQLLQ